MKNFEINLSKYILAEAYKLDTPENVINGLKTKQIGAKVDQNFQKNIDTKVNLNESINYFNY